MHVPQWKANGNRLSANHTWCCDCLFSGVLSCSTGSYSGWLAGWLARQLANWLNGEVYHDRSWCYWWCNIHIAATKLSTNPSWSHLQQLANVLGGIACLAVLAVLVEAEKSVSSQVCFKAKNPSFLVTFRSIADIACR